MPFSSLNLDPEIVKALVDSGYSKPTPIQEAAIPQILAGADLLASAQTGSGKTAAFILPALHKLREPAKIQAEGPRVLILVPTRELAMQVATQAVKYSKHLVKMRTVCLYGGAPYPVQNRQLSRPYEILVATPGRLIDHLDHGRIDMSRVELFVLDEADRMLDMGFISSVERLSAELPKNVQTVLFSATLEGDILRLSRNLLKKPIEINLAGNKRKHESIEQFMYYADNLNHKLKLLEAILKDPEITQAIIFTSTKFFANELVNILDEAGRQVGVLHGDLNQRQRTNTTRQFREGKISLLVATDVAARGIDIPSISHVINFDLPPNTEDYIHRIGRTGRADAKGTALSFALSRDRMLVERIEKFTGRTITIKTVEGMEPSFKDTKSGRSSYGASRGAPRGGAPRGGQRGYGSRPPRDFGDAPQRDRAPQGYGDRAPREFSDAPPRDRAPRSFSDAPPRDRAPRSYSDAPPRDRAPRSYSDAPPRDRAPRSYSDAPPRDRAPRSYSDAPPRDRAPQGYGDRAPRAYGDAPSRDRAPSGERRGGYSKGKPNGPQKSRPAKPFFSRKHVE